LPAEGEKGPIGRGDWLPGTGAAFRRGLCDGGEPPRMDERGGRGPAPPPREGEEGSLPTRSKCLTPTRGGASLSPPTPPGSPSSLSTAARTPAAIAPMREVIRPETDDTTADRRRAEAGGAGREGMKRAARDLCTYARMAADAPAASTPPHPSQPASPPTARSQISCRMKRSEAHSQGSRAGWRPGVRRSARRSSRRARSGRSAEGNVGTRGGTPTPHSSSAGRRRTDPSSVGGVGGGAAAPNPTPAAPSRAARGMPHSALLPRAAPASPRLRRSRRVSWERVVKSPPRLGDGELALAAVWPAAPAHAAAKEHTELARSAAAVARPSPRASISHSRCERVNTNRVSPSPRTERGRAVHSAAATAASDDVKALGPPQGPGMARAARRDGLPPLGPTMRAAFAPKPPAQPMTAPLVASRTRPVKE
jgi:hypothetical protein